MHDRSCYIFPTPVLLPLPDKYTCINLCLTLYTLYVSNFQPWYETEQGPCYEVQKGSDRREKLLK
jgi:hypothetical protein